MFFEHFRSVLELGLQSKDMVKKVEIELQDNEFLIEPGLMRMAWNMWRYTSNGRARIFLLSIKMGVGFWKLWRGNLAKALLIRCRRTEFVMANIPIFLVPSNLFLLRITSSTTNAPEGLTYPKKKIVS